MKTLAISVVMGLLLGGCGTAREIVYQDDAGRLRVGKCWDTPLGASCTGPGYVSGLDWGPW